MLLIVKKKFSLYKTYKLDIWNLFFNALKLAKNKKRKQFNNKYVRFFFQMYQKHLSFLDKLNERYAYRTDVKKVYVYRKFYNRLFLELRLHKLHYVTLDYYQFYRMRSKAIKKDGLYEEHICLALEGRIISCLYRLNFFSTIFKSMSFLLKSYVWVDRKIVEHYNFVLTIGHFFGVYYNKTRRIRKSLLMRGSKGGFLFSIPRYIIISYKLFYAFFYKYPRVNDITFPFDFNFSRILGYNLG